MKKRKGGIAMDRDVFDEQLDALLAQRIVPEMRSNLAHRIIEASHEMPQDDVFYKKVGGAFLKGVASILDCVALPQPVFAVAVVVIMLGGMALGARTGGLRNATLLSDIGYISSDDSSDVETFIMATDSFEYGDFL